MKTIITGATGLLGPALIKTFSEDNETVGIYRNNSLPTKIKLRQGELCEPNVVTQIITEEQPELIIHAAGLADVNKCEKNPQLAEKINKDTTINLINACAQLSKKPKIVFISTDYVFDGSRGSYEELDQALPLNEYGRTKLESERQLQESTVPHLIIRTSFYGWSVQAGRESFAEWIINSLKEEKKIYLTTDQFNSMLLINDVAALIKQLVEKEATGIYHIGCREQVSKHEFGKMCAHMFNLKEELIVPVTYEKLTRILKKKSTKKPMNVSLNTNKIEKLLGQKMPSCQESIERMKEIENIYKKNFSLTVDAHQSNNT